MSYSPAARRRRRRRTIAILLLVGAVFGIAYGVFQAQGEREATRAFLDLAYDASQTANEAAAALATLVDVIEDYNRAVLIERLGVMEADTEEVVAILVDAEIPRALGEAAVWLRIAAGAWRSGMSDVRAGLLALSSNPLDEEGTTALTQGLIDLRVGDRAYGGFLAAIEEIDTSLQGGPFPTVTFVPPADEERYSPLELSRRMFLSGSIAPVDDIAVSDLRLEPGPAGERDGLPVLAVTADQGAVVAVANRGNVAVTAITVRLRLVSNTGELYEAEQDIPGLEANTLTSLTFGSLPVTSGVTYEVTISIDRPDDDEENDSLTYRFTVNPGG